MYRPDNLNSGMRCIKYLLIAVNFLFVITGIIVIIIGSTINSIYSDFSPFLEAKHFSPSALLVSIGFIIFAVACLGCLGALRESAFMIMMFSFFLLIIFILEVATGLSAYFLATQVQGLIAHQMIKIFNLYSTDKQAATIFDALQEELHCCGVKSPNDWAHLPDSCYYPDSAVYYGTGCLPRLIFLIKESGYLLAGVAIIIACSQLFGVIFSCSLGRILRIQKTKRDQKRLLVREQVLSNYDNYVIDQKPPVP